MGTVLDLGLATVVLLSLLGGFRRGFAEILLSLVAWVGAYLLALHMTGPLVNAAPDWAKAVPGGTGVAGILLFLVFFSLMRILTHITGLGGSENLGSTDRLFGAVVGLTRGLLLAGILASLALAIAPGSTEGLRRSRVLPYLAPLGRTVAQFAPQWLRERIDSGWDHLHEPNARQGSRAARADANFGERRCPFSS